MSKYFEVKQTQKTGICICFDQGNMQAAIEAKVMTVAGEDVSIKYRSKTVSVGLKISGPNLKQPIFD